MAGFLKILLRNVLEGPSTDPFPLGETFTPKRFRGKVVLNPDLCVGCGICRHTCAAGAINIHVRPDQTGYDFTVWHNSCCLCASCRHYCPTGAITLSNDWHNAHTQEEKFTWLEQKFVPYIPCAGCGTPMRPIPLSIAKKIYLNNTDVDWEQIIKLCPKCRQIEDARKHTTPLPQTGEDGVEGPEVKAETPKPEVQVETKPAEPAPAAQAGATGEPAKPDDVAAPIAAPQTPRAVLEKALTPTEPAPRPEAKPEKTAAKPTEKPAEKPAAKAAPRADDKPKAQTKPAASAPAKNKGKNKGKKTK